MSSSSCTGGRPDRRQRLYRVSISRKVEDQGHALFIKKVGDPKDPLPLFNLHWVETKSRPSLMQANAVGQADGRGNQEESGLRIGCALEEE